MDTLRDAMKKYGFWLLWLALAAALLVRVRYCTCLLYTSDAADE